MQSRSKGGNGDRTQVWAKMAPWSDAGAMRTAIMEGSKTHRCSCAPGSVVKGVDMCQPRVFARTAKRLANLSRLLYPDIPSLTPDEFVERSQRAEWSTVDVRTPGEQRVSIIRSALSVEAFEAQV